MSETLETLLEENRAFPPSSAFSSQANIADPDVYSKAFGDLEAYWQNWARELHWFEPWSKTLEWNLPFSQWFVGGRLNASFNCLDRHVEGGLADRTAIIWEGEPGDVRKLSYRELLADVCQLANALKALGVKKGDRVCIYLPMVPELVVSMLACARIGAVHSVIFGGFSAESLFDRINDAQAKLIITADGGWRRGSIVPLKKAVDDAIEMGCPSVESVLMLTRAGMPGEDRSGWTTREYNRGTWVSGRDYAWQDVVHQQATSCPCEVMESEDLLFILYTSGSTGKPKGIMHTTGGYMVGTYATSKWVFDLRPNDVYWCTADCGWITGHSYVVYGPLANAATVVMYEGSPDTPDKDRFWQIVEKHRVTILYTAPTAIRTFMKWGEQFPDRCDLSSLRLLGSVGEPINPEAWIWYHRTIGRLNCPVVDTWWQTETGAIMISPLPGITTTKPGSATQPFPGIKAIVVDESGNDITPIQGALGYYANSSGREAPERGPARGGYLCIAEPWPSMTRGIWGDPQRFIDVYWSKFPGLYFTGDGTKVDEDGYFWLLGRVDDVMLVAGHNISTMEVESALVDHHAVAEAAVIGKTHDIKGQAIAAFVIIRSEVTLHDGLVEELRAHVAAKIGPIARPDDIIISAELPKTRSGKIMRRLLRDVAEGRALGDTTTLADPAVVNALKEKYEDSES